jgi:dolichol-phosphate mannosyltransferase
MYKSRRIILIAPAHNEEAKIAQVLLRTPREIVDKILVVDDGSTDQTAEQAQSAGAEVIRLTPMQGVGAAIRAGYRVAQDEGFHIAVTIAGNNKDDPAEIPRLLDPICDDDYEFVMGSRFLRGGGYGGDMPLYRRLATRLHPFLVSLFTGRRVTESTNGFRAIKVSALRNPALNLNQPWLDGYELEVYLLMKVLMLRLRTTEVPVTKIYPPRRIGYTKMRPVVDWWRMLKPVFLIGLRLA